MDMTEAHSRIQSIIARMKDRGMNAGSFKKLPSQEAINALLQGDAVPAMRSLYRDNPNFIPHEHMTLTQAKQIINGFIQDISENFIRPRSVVGIYETMLHKRWAKKSREQRTRILLSAWQNMTQEHRPELRLMWREKDPAK